VNYPARRTSRKLSGGEATHPNYKERYGSREEYRKELKLKVTVLDVSVLGEQ
jgi:hypothetical protein